MAVISNTSFPGWSRQEVTENSVRNLIVNKFQAIVDDYDARMTSYKADKTVLTKGFWYNNDYFKALKELGQQTRLEWMVKKGAFYHGYAPASVFKTMNDPFSASGLSVDAYCLKEGVLATKGLDAIQDDLNFIDCMEAIELCYYRTLREIFGDEKFNRQFAANSINPLNFNPVIGRTSLRDFFSQKTKNLSAVKEGDRVVFANVPAYTSKHPLGEFGALNALCLPNQGEKRFIAFGCPPSGESENEILSRLAMEMNQKAIPTDEMITPQVKARLTTTEQLFNMPYSAFENLTISSQQIRTVAGFQDSEVVSPNIAAIKDHL